MKLTLLTCAAGALGLTPALHGMLGEPQEPLAPPAPLALPTAPPALARVAAPVLPARVVRFQAQEDDLEENADRLEAEIQRLRKELSNVRSEMRGAKKRETRERRGRVRLNATESAAGQKLQEKIREIEEKVASNGWQKANSSHRKAQAAIAELTQQLDRLNAQEMRKERASGGQKEIRLQWEQAQETAREHAEHAREQAEEARERGEELRERAEEMHERAVEMRVRVQERANEARQRGMERADEARARAEERREVIEERIQRFVGEQNDGTTVWSFESDEEDGDEPEVRVFKRSVTAKAKPGGIFTFEADADGDKEAGNRFFRVQSGSDATIETDGQNSFNIHVEDGDVHIHTHGTSTFSGLKGAKASGENAGQNLFGAWTTTPPSGTGLSKIGDGEHSFKIMTRFETDDDGEHDLEIEINGEAVDIDDLGDMVGELGGTFFSGGLGTIIGEHGIEGLASLQDIDELEVLEGLEGLEMLKGLENLEGLEDLGGLIEGLGAEVGGNVRFRVMGLDDLKGDLSELTNELRGLHVIVEEGEDCDDDCDEECDEEDEAEECDEEDEAQEGASDRKDLVVRGDRYPAVRGRYTLAANNAAPTSDYWPVAAPKALTFEEQMLEMTRAIQADVQAMRAELDELRREVLSAPRRSQR